MQNIDPNNHLMSQVSRESIDLQGFLVLTSLTLYVMTLETNLKPWVTRKNNQQKHTLS